MARIKIKNNEEIDFSKFPTPLDSIYNILSTKRIFDISKYPDMAKFLLIELMKPKPNRKVIEGVLGIKIEEEEYITIDDIRKSYLDLGIIPFISVKEFKKALKSFPDNLFEYVYSNTMLDIEVIDRWCFKDITPYDGYGSVIVSIDGQEWNCLNTYGDEDTYPDDTIYCVCAVSNNRYIVGDICYDGERLEIKRKKEGDLPAILKNRVREFGDKRGFYYHRAGFGRYKKDSLLLRCSDMDFLKTLPNRMVRDYYVILSV